MTASWLIIPPTYFKVNPRRFLIRELGEKLIEANGFCFVFFIMNLANQALLASLVYRLQNLGLIYFYDPLTWVS